MARTYPSGLLEGPTKQWKYFRNTGFTKGTNVKGDSLFPPHVVSTVNSLTSILSLADPKLSTSLTVQGPR